MLLLCVVVIVATVVGVVVVGAICCCIFTCVLRSLLSLLIYFDFVVCAKQPNLIIVYQD